MRNLMSEIQKNLTFFLVCIAIVVALALLARHTPTLHRAVLSVYDRKWFQAAAQLILFAILFVWYNSELDGAVYVMAPIV